jgi:hypothetical protein
MSPILPLARTALPTNQAGIRAGLAFASETLKADVIYPVVSVIQTRDAYRFAARSFECTLAVHQSDVMAGALICGIASV